MPFFSIVIPVYNVEAYIEECLESVFNQTCKDYEVIVVDDGSTDSSREICAEFIERFGLTATVITKKNQGLFMARRTGLKMASGEYLVMLDGDDALRFNALERVKNVIDSSHADIVLINHTTDPAFKTQAAKTAWPVSGLIDDKAQLLIKLCSTRQLNSAPKKIVKKSCFDINQDYSDYTGLNMGEDLLQAIALFDKATSLFALNESLYFYRQNPDSITKRFNMNYYYDSARTRAALLAAARQWEKVYGLPNLREMVLGVSFQGIGETVERLFQTEGYIAAVCKVEEIIASDHFVIASSCSAGMRYCRVDYRQLGRLLKGNHFLSAYFFVKLQQFVRHMRSRS